MGKGGGSSRLLPQFQKGFLILFVLRKNSLFLCLTAILHFEPRPTISCITLPITVEITHEECGWDIRAYISLPAEAVVGTTDLFIRSQKIRQFQRKKKPHVRVPKCDSSPSPCARIGERLPHGDISVSGDDVRGTTEDQAVDSLLVNLSYLESTMMSIQFFFLLWQRKA